MSSVTMRISRQTHGKLRELAKEAGRPMQDVMEEAVEEYRCRKFLEGLAQDFAALRKDKKAWEEVLEERRAFDGTLMDGLEEE